MRSLALVFVLVACVAPAWATVITTGDVDPGGAGTQPDPWSIEGTLKVGDYWDGTLNVRAGSVVSNSDGYIGYTFGSTGEVTVSGAGSKWTNSDSLLVGESGDGRLNIDSGGEVSSAGGPIGTRSGSTGIVTVTGAGSKWTDSGSLPVGYYGNGTLNVENEGEVSSAGGWIGYHPGSTGEATITGVDSKWNNSDLLSVGTNSVGTLNVKSGGVVSNTEGYIGSESGSTGAATVTGTGSKWNNSSSFYVGHSSSGTLNVRAGGVVSNSDGYIGYAIDSTGEVTVSGAGSKWINSDSLLVGESGDGRLNVDSGGEVSSAGGPIGTRSGSTGIVTVTGAGSKWTDSGSLPVGYYGNGTLNVENGGEVSSAGGWIGYYPGSTGEATITGAGSKWDNSDDLYIGGGALTAGGSGTLNIHDSGLVTVSDTTKLWDDGIMNLDGGTLDTGTLDLAVGTFNMLAGLLRADSVIGDINVQGGIVAPGHSPGVLTITGDYAQGADATLEIEVAGTSVGEFGYDQLSVSGTVSLDGTLDILTDASFTPGVEATAGVVGDWFVIVSAENVTGTFATINGRHVGDGKFYLPQYHATQVTLGAFQAAPGDTDGDRDVDLSDYNTITTNFDPIGAYGPHVWQDGNFDEDGDIDLSDYNSLASNFKPLGYGAAAVPEPSTALLALLALNGLTGLFWIRGRRQGTIGMRASTNSTRCVDCMLRDASGYFDRLDSESLRLQGSCDATGDREKIQPNPGNDSGFSGPAARRVARCDLRTTVRAF